MATYADLSEIVRMGRAFHGSTVHGQSIEFDPLSFETLCVGLIDGDDSVLAVTDEVDGMAAAITVPCMCNFSVLVSSELWVYTERPGSGKSLIQALEQWARDVGAASQALMQQLNLKDTSAIYHRLGYEPVETIYTKRL